MEQKNKKLVYKPLEKLGLGMIMLITFFLALKQMAPFNSFDELEIMNWIKDLETNPFPALKYPPFFLYIHYILSFFYGKIVTLMGFVDAASKFVSDDFGYRFTLEAGRVFNAFVGTSLVYVVFKTGKDFFNKQTGIAAALLISANSLIILYSHIFKPDILITLLLAITLYFLLKYLADPQPHTILITSFFFGLSVAVKFNAFPVLLLLVAAVLFSRKPKTPFNKKFKKSLLYVPAGAAIGFFLGAPNWLIHPILNIEKFLGQYSPGEGKIYKQMVVQSPWGIYWDFLQDILIYFGPVFFVVFVAALFVSLFSKKRKDIFMVAFLVSYIFLLAFFGYFADRFGMPLFPIIALLIAKTLFVDLKKAAEKFKLNNTWRYASVLLWIPFIAYCIIGYNGIIKDYNLLKTESENERTIEYRTVHNIDPGPYFVGRQMFTPRIKKRNIKITKWFNLKSPQLHGKKTLHFIQAHLPSYKSYMAGEGVWSDDAINLDNHRPFYEITKKDYQPWNSECLFLYKVSPFLKDIRPPKNNTIPLLPRIYYRDGFTTFLPMQIYEKNPLFGKLKNNSYRHWFYSTQEIQSFKLNIFTPGKKCDLKIIINGKTFILNKGGKAQLNQLELTGIKPKSFFHQYVYHVNIKPIDDSLQNVSYYFTWEPICKNQEKSLPIHLFKEPVSGNIPRLFSDDTYADWMKQLYQKTGIDLALLKYIGFHQLYNKNEAETCYYHKKKSGDVSIDFIPLEKGVYSLDVTAKKLIKQYEPGTGTFIEIEIYSEKGIRKQRIEMQGKLTINEKINITEPLSFIRIQIKGLRANNYILNRVTLTPDYINFINRHYIIDNPKPKAK